MECDIFPSVLWRCWLGDREVIWPVKTGCWFVGGDDVTGALHDIYSSCHHHFHHPLLQWTPANPGSPGKWPLKRRDKRENSSVYFTKQHMLWTSFYCCCFHFINKMCVADIWLDDRHQEHCDRLRSWTAAILSDGRMASSVVCVLPAHDKRSALLLDQLCFPTVATMNYKCAVVKL